MKRTESGGIQEAATSVTSPTIYLLPSPGTQPPFSRGKRASSVSFHPHCEWKTNTRNLVCSSNRVTKNQINPSSSSLYLYLLYVRLSFFLVFFPCSFFMQSKVVLLLCVYTYVYVQHYLKDIKWSLFVLWNVTSDIFLYQI